MTGQFNPQTSLDRLQRLVGRHDLPCSTSDNTLAVDGANFAHLLDTATLALHCPVDQKVLLMEISPDIYFETDQHIGHDIMLIRLNRISDEELALRLHDAWTFRAPEKLKQRF